LILILLAFIPYTKEAFGTGTGINSPNDVGGTWVDNCDIAASKINGDILLASCKYNDGWGRARVNLTECSDGSDDVYLRYDDDGKNLSCYKSYKNEWAQAIKHQNAYYIPGSLDGCKDNLDFAGVYDYDDNGNLYTVWSLACYANQSHTYPFCYNNASYITFKDGNLKCNLSDKIQSYPIVPIQTMSKKARKPPPR
jgi:hypothetical protein